MLINYIRKNKILTGLFIGSIIVVFAGVPVIRMLDAVTIKVPFFAKVGKTEISYYQYKSKYDRLLARYQYKKVDPRYASAHAHRDVFSEMVKKIAISGTLETLGIDHITRSEIIDHVLGDNISKQLQDAFTNPKTGVFEKDKLLTFLKNQNESGSGQEFLKSFEMGIITERKEKKLNTISNGVQSTKIDQAHQDYLQKSEAVVSYVFIPAKSVLPSTVSSIPQKEKKKYLEQQQAKGKFKRKKSKRVKYCLFRAVLSQSDKEAPKKALESLKAPLEQAIVSGDMLRVVAFARKYSDNPNNAIMQCKESQVPPLIMRELKTDSKTGSSRHVAGPILNAAGKHVLYGLVRKTSGWFSGTTYTLVMIEMGATISDTTKQDTEIRGNRFAHNIKSEEQFEKKAKSSPYKSMILRVDELDIPEEHAQEVGYKDEYHQIAYWAHAKGKVNKPSDTIELTNNKYVVLMVVEEKKEGLMSLKEADSQVKNEMIKQRQINAIRAAIVNSEDSILPFNEIKMKYPHHAVWIDSETVSANKIALTHGGECPNAIGSILGMEVGTTKIFACKEGILVVKCMSKRKKEKVAQEKANQQNMAARVIHAFTKKIKSKVKDRRYEFVSNS